MTTVHPFSTSLHFQIIAFFSSPKSTQICSLFPLYCVFFIFFPSLAQAACGTEQVLSSQQIHREHLLLTTGFFFLAHYIPYCFLTTRTHTYWRHWWVFNQANSFHSSLCSPAQFNRLLPEKCRGRHSLTQLALHTFPVIRCGDSYGGGIFFLKRNSTVGALTYQRNSFTINTKFQARSFESSMSGNEW